MRIEKRGRTIGYNVSSSTFIYLMTEWRNQKGEYLTRDPDREPNIFSVLNIMRKPNEVIVLCLYVYIFLKQSAMEDTSL